MVSSGDLSERYSELNIDDHKPLMEAPFQIDLIGYPRPGSTLSADAYLKHAVGGQPLPDAAETFRATSSAIDSFVAFDGAFASQQDLSDFLACWAFSTYALDAFDTVGYVWPNGERGSGKTQCLKTLMALSFMGQTIASESSFASVRDEAALGASIGFDDCENIKKMESGKRELLLAGNTKGAGFMHKEPGKREGTRKISKHRCLCATRLYVDRSARRCSCLQNDHPIPLGRTADVEKTRRKPTNLRDWVLPPSTLRDAIWLNVATDLLAIEAHKEQVSRDSDHAGRDFDIFQPAISIAYWLEHSKGVADLYPRMCSVMDLYHASKHRTLLPSFEHLVLQSCYNILVDEKAERTKVSTSKIAFGVEQVCRNWDITDETLCTVDNQKVGMMLQRLGFEKDRAHGKERGWHIGTAFVLEKARSAGVTIEMSLL